MLSFLYSPTHIHIWLLEKPNRCFHILRQTESNLDGLHCTLHKAHSFLVGTTSCGPLLPILTLWLLITNSDCFGLLSGPWSPRPSSAIAFSDLCFLLRADGFSPTLHRNSARVSGLQRVIPAGPLHLRYQLWDTELPPAGFWEPFPGDNSLGGKEGSDGQRSEQTHNEMAPEAFIEPTESSKLGGLLGLS